MGLLSELALSDSCFQPYLNTGTLFDIQTGVFIPGDHGGMVLNGGLTTTNAVVGREQMFKSTELFSYVIQAMLRYPQSECYVYDTEYSLKKERLIQFAPELDYASFNERMIIQTPMDLTAGEWFANIKKIQAHKLAKAKDYMVDSPLLDPRTGKRLKVWIPTFVVVDSWSVFSSEQVQEVMDTKVLGSSDTNMIFMKDGIIKKMMLSQIPRMAATAGMYFMLSAHIGNKFELNPYAPSNKSLPLMKSTDKPKTVGSEFNFLMSNYIQMHSVSPLIESKEPIYPLEGSGDSELNEVVSIMLRCKNNMSGTLLRTVVSQRAGILPDMSNYHYLRKNDYFGLIGNSREHKPAMTDIALSRGTVRKKLGDPKLCHALELIAQLSYIQDNWAGNITGDVDFSMKPKALAEKLLANDGPTTDDILSSRSWWTYDKTNTQPFMSLYDVLAIAQGVYRAKGISMAQSKTKK